MKIGIVGATGLMGHGIAKNVLAGGNQVTVFSHRRRAEDLIQAGAQETDDLAALGHDCELVLICVTGANEVRHVVDELLVDPAEHLVILDHSTSEPEVTLELAQRCADEGVSFADAPLTRTPREAEDGRLNVLIGGDQALVEQVRPVLDCFAENIFHTGPVGSAHTIKLINNFVVQAGVNALAEAFAVTDRAGVDSHKLVQVLDAGMFSNDLLAGMARTLDGDFDAMKFELDNARKDMRYYLRLAFGMGCPTLVGDGVHESLTVASALGYGNKTVPHVVAAQQKLNGDQVA